MPKWIASTGWILLGLSMLGVAAISTRAAEGDAKDGKPMTLKLRSRTQAQPGGAWEPREAETQIQPAETAIIICDMWDKHWCQSASRRCGELALKMAPIIDNARARGMTIIHCPSDTIDFYRDTPQRHATLAAPPAKPPVEIGRWRRLDKDREGELPIDDADGGCDDEPACKNYKAWSRQHPAISIQPGDAISDNGQEVYNVLKQRGIKSIIYVGVHTNMCVLGRSFGIRQMSGEGFKTMLVRDLTDTMYNPRRRPLVSHAQGTELVIEHVEKHWCPTLSSDELARALRP